MLRVSKKVLLLAPSKRHSRHRNKKCAGAAGPIGKRLEKSCVRILERTWSCFCAALQCSCLKGVVHEVMFVLPWHGSCLNGRTQKRSEAWRSKQTQATFRDLQGHVSHVRLRCCPHTHIPTYAPEALRRWRVYCAGSFDLVCRCGPLPCPKCGFAEVSSLFLRDQSSRLPAVAIFAALVASSAGSMQLIK